MVGGRPGGGAPRRQDALVLLQIPWHSRGRPSKRWRQLQAAQRRQRRAGWEWVTPVAEARASRLLAAPRATHHLWGRPGRQAGGRAGRQVGGRAGGRAGRRAARQAGRQAGRGRWGSMCAHLICGHAAPPLKLLEEEQVEGVGPSSRGHLHHDHDKVGKEGTALVSGRRSACEQKVAGVWKEVTLSTQARLAGRQAGGVYHLADSSMLGTTGWQQKG